MCILITAFPIKVAPKKVQKGTRKCPHVIPARSNRGFGIWGVQGKEVQELLPWNATDFETLKNEHFPLIQLDPKLLYLNTYKNVNVTPHNLSLWDSARQHRRQFHSHGPSLPPDFKQANKKLSLCNAQKPQQSHFEWFIKFPPWQAHPSWTPAFRWSPATSIWESTLKTGIYSHMYPV